MGNHAGAELKHTGKTILVEIPSSASDLGTLYGDYTKKIKIVADINSIGLEESDSVYVENKFMGTGNFAVSDTFEANISNIIADDLMSVPVYGEPRATSLRWSIRRNGDAIDEKEWVTLEGECQEEAYMALEITHE